MKFIISLSILIIFFTSLQGQPNLIPNPSFEQYYSCPNTTAQVDSCIGWNTIWQSPDYFNACSNSVNADVPINFVGNHFAFDGNAYMGMIVYIPPVIPLYREIIGAYLLDTLTVGNKYHLSMRVVRSGNEITFLGAVASNKIGARFSTERPINFDSTNIDNTATVFSDSVIVDSLNWTLLSWEFIADSNYTYISIGNFFDGQHVDTLILPPFSNYVPGPYYYCLIDSVTLQCISSNCLTSIEEDEINAIHVAQKEYSIDIVNNSNVNYKIEIFSGLGQLIYYNLLKGNTTVKLEKLPSGINIIRATNLTNPKIFIKKIQVTQ